MIKGPQGPVYWLPKETTIDNYLTRLCNSRKDINLNMPSDKTTVKHQRWQKGSTRMHNKYLHLCSLFLESLRRLFASISTTTTICQRYLRRILVRMTVLEAKVSGKGGQKLCSYHSNLLVSAQINYLLGVRMQRVMHQLAGILRNVDVAWK